MTNTMEQLGIKLENPGAYGGYSYQSAMQENGLIASVNPNHKTSLASYCKCENEEYERVMQIAEKGFSIWRKVPAPKRGEIIRALGDAFRRDKSILGELISVETGKSRQEGEGEVQEVIDFIDFAVGQSRMLYGVTMPSERVEHRMYEQWHPMGIVGVITAFNFPMAVWAWNAMIAAVCGDVVVWKPSPKASLSAIAVQGLCNEIFSKHGYDGVFSLVLSDEASFVERFVDDSRFPLISFTGSTSIGKRVNQRVAKRLGRCLLELSGNNAIIVDETADLSLAIPAIVFGAVGTSGQRCTSTRRVIVHESIASTIKMQLIQAYKQVTIGDSLNEKNLMGPLIDQVAVNAFSEKIALIKKEGGEILFGGSVIDSDGYFVEPTLVCIDEHSDILQEEAFSPILYIIAYQDFDDAIILQNNSRHGLSSSIFSTNLQRVEKFLSSFGSDCGLANVNGGTSGAEIGGAFGGEKETGGGREAGSDSWKAYMRRQTVTINWGSTLPLAQGIKFDIE
jgi:aldehyde dehydrogenase (NAD+)